MGGRAAVADGATDNEGAGGPAGKGPPGVATIIGVAAGETPVLTGVPSDPPGLADMLPGVPVAVVAAGVVVVTGSPVVAPPVAGAAGFGPVVS
jgi:hypothetical protein